MLVHASMMSDSSLCIRNIDYICRVVLWKLDICLTFSPETFLLPLVKAIEFTRGTFKDRNFVKQATPEASCNVTVCSREYWREND